MTNKGLSRYALYAIDRLIDLSPVIIPRVLHRSIITILGGSHVFSFYRKKYTRILKRAKAFNKILVLGDIGIGDAVNVQQVVNVLKDLFPEAAIDYLCHVSCGEVLSPLPAANRVFELFQGHGVASRHEHLKIRSLLQQSEYDVILNFSPFVNTKKLGATAVVADLYIPMAAYVMRTWKMSGGPRHISSMLRLFLQELFVGVVQGGTRAYAEGMDGRAATQFEGNSIYLSHLAIETARQFLKRQNLQDSERLVFFNPDGSCKYSQIPHLLQIQIIERLLASDDIGAILIGAGHSDVGIEKRIMKSLQGMSRGKLFIVPPQPLPVFAAITDACDVFISGDGGPVHIAAAKKIPISREDSVRNHTAVVSIFGATDSRMYGYDSALPDHFPAYQKAPSKVFVGNASCRNITCINKLGKSCKEVRCFQEIDAEAVASYVKSYCRQLRLQEEHLSDRVEVR